MADAAGTSWTIVGCGYAGERLAAHLLAAGATVIATTRRAERASWLAAAHSALEVRVATPLEPSTLEGAFAAGGVVVDSIPPSGEPHQPALVAAAAHAGARRVVYLSSTGVYGRGDGGWVDEDSPVSGDGERAGARLFAEQALIAAAGGAGLEAVVLRIAAIYGPGRGVHERLRAGDYAVAGDGSNWVSRVHVDDLAATIVSAGLVQPLPRAVYVVADDEPSQARAHADGVAALMGLPPPPSVAAGELAPAAAELRQSSRRVRNTRLKAELGVTLRYPTWREGVAACLGLPPPAR